MCARIFSCPERTSNFVNHIWVMFAIFLVAGPALLTSATVNNTGKTLSTLYTYNITDFPSPRIQWNENDGYCGEVSTICAAMSFGAYYSQYDLRFIASNYKQKNPQTSTSYLLGVNDVATAKRVQLRATAWDSRIKDTQKFLLWVKQQVMAGNRVALGVFTNEYLFYGDTKPTAGDDEYDHIVSVYSVGSNYKDNDVYHGDDTITISDHALWSPGNRPTYLFTYTFDGFQGTRRDANAKKGRIYTLPSAKGLPNYGIAHQGPIDESGQLLPVRLQTDKNYETPEIGRNSNTRPAASPLRLTITVSQLQAGVRYKLYKYNNESIVPTSAYNANAAKSIAQWEISSASGQVVTIIDNILSSDKAIFRCVRADAP